MMKAGFQKFNVLFIFLFVLASTFLYAGEGMWLPLLLKSLNEAEMKSMGMKMSAEDIYSVNKGSLKDAVVHFGGFCTGEVVSEQGLLFTNHHCGYDAIQSHSTLEKNYLKDGFWAQRLEDELPNPGLFATFIIRMEDVTADALKGLETAADDKERQSLLDKNLNAIRSTAKKEAWQDVFVRSFFEGNQYYMFITETYHDVRLVGTPPESIGKFGADTDNWVWPRHTGDFSVFRIYAGPDNKPAEYSPENKPYKPRHFFPISIDGVDEGDFTLVFGFPGRTNQYLPSYAVAQTADIIDPARVGVRDISLGIMDKYMRQDEDIRLAYASKYAGLSNSWKKWIGEMQGLTSKNAVAIKEQREAEFTSLLQKQKKYQDAYGHILPELKSAYGSMDALEKNRYVLGEIIGGSNTEVFRLAGMADRLIKAYDQNGESGYRKQADEFTSYLEGFYKEYRTKVDHEVFTSLITHLRNEVTSDYMPEVLKSKNKGEATTSWAEDIYKRSILIQQDSLYQMLADSGNAFTSIVRKDEVYQLYTALKKVMDESISPQATQLQKKIQPLQKLYVQALMDVYPDKRFWPDANSTLRVAYGQVEPYAPRDGVDYKTQTYLEGIMEKYKPGDYEFDVHPKLLDLYHRKDYGVYGENGKLPVCFIASNHTTGGNSGSPAIDAHGNLIGINFDRVWEGTMSDLYYDKSICRNIMVDMRYVLFVIDKFAGAGHLIREMKIVDSKS